MARLQRIAPCFWFDDGAEQAANFYISIFPNSRICEINRYSEVGHQTHGQPAGSVLTVNFELDGQRFTALNGGPLFQFSEAISLQIHCDSQAEIDHYWDALTDGGDPKAQNCGWLKDRFGLSWQVVPSVLTDLFTDPQTPQARRVMAEVLQMKKIDLDRIRELMESA